MEVRFNEEQDKQSTDLLMKNKLIPQMRGRRQLIDLGNGFIVDTPKPDIISNMYGYTFNNKKGEN